MAVAKGTVQLGVGIDKALMEELRAFVERRGEKIRAVVEMALRRHMDNPPPASTPPPLPPVTSAAPEQPAPPPAKGKGKPKKK